MIEVILLLLVVVAFVVLKEFFASFENRTPGTLEDDADADAADDNLTID